MSQKKRHWNHNIPNNTNWKIIRNNKKKLEVKNMTFFSVEKKKFTTMCVIILGLIINC